MKISLVFTYLLFEVDVKPFAVLPGVNGVLFSVVRPEELKHVSSFLAGRRDHLLPASDAPAAVGRGCHAPRVLRPLVGGGFHGSGADAGEGGVVEIGMVPQQQGAVLLVPVAF